MALHSQFGHRILSYWNYVLCRIALENSRMLPKNDLFAGFINEVAEHKVHWKNLQNSQEFRRLKSEIEDPSQLQEIEKLLQTAPGGFPDPQPASWSSWISEQAQKPYNWLLVAGAALVGYAAWKWWKK